MKTRLQKMRVGALAASLVALTAAGVSGCAEDLGPHYYSPYEQGAVAPVDEGRVVGFRPIQFGPGDTTGGAVVGGVGGAVVGSALAGRGDRGLGAVLGGLGGALLGSAVANGQRTNGFAYVISIGRDGRRIEVPQADPEPIPVGTRVYVSYEGGRARVAPVGYGPPQPPPGARY